MRSGSSALALSPSCPLFLMADHFVGGHLVLTEHLCRPFILLHLTYTLITTTARFFLPTPLPPPPTTSSSSSPSPPSPPSAFLPFHHSRSLVSHFLSTFLLALNTVALSHTSPWLWTGPPHHRRLITNPASIPRPPRQPRPVWLRSPSDERDPALLWDLSACLLLLYAVALAASLAHQLLFSPFTFASPDSARRPSPARRRRLLSAYAASAALAMALGGLMWFAWKVHVDAAVELVPWVLVEAMRVAQTWQVMCRGGKVLHVTDAERRLRGVDEDEKDTTDDGDEEDEEEEEEEETEAEEFADLIEGATETTGLHHRPAAPLTSMPATSLR